MQESKPSTQPAARALLFATSVLKHLLCFGFLLSRFRLRRRGESLMAIFGRILLLSLVLFTFPATMAAQAAQNAGARTPAAAVADLLIRNGTILTVTHGVLQNGSVLVH